MLTVLVVSLLGIVSDDQQDTARAEPAAPPEPPVVLATQVQALTAQADRQVDKLDAIERFLRDQQAVREGRCPKGWTQPPMSAYLDGSAPALAVPLPGAEVVAHPTVVEASR